MKTFDVLVVGELNVDIILDDIQGFPKIGKEILAHNFNLTLGSSSAIFASNLCALGSTVAFMGKIGTDDFAVTVESSLRQKNVDTGFILKSDTYKTGATVVMNYDMDRANITFPGAMEHLKEEEVTDAILKSAKHLHLSSVFLQTALKKDIVRLFKRAKNLGLTTSMDPQWDPQETWDLDLSQLLPVIDVFLPNVLEFQFLTDSDNIASGLKKMSPIANHVVIKDGENGAHLWSDGAMVSKTAYRNDTVVDCIGAGDSFDAGFIHRYIQGKPLTECLEFGNVTGAINTTASGGTAAFKNREYIGAIAKNQFSYDIEK
ncbi:Sugar or nucleoside kinase, ribokinase family [Pricia antarctica]|uniref:Sugar or nucleoside kinase, ribokinase family n=1 Tax=Pricia antarctica TaxID=641691 RepID=A0A1G7HUT5_9FLAO|nr:carbohydrate kinase family protein [Pricia antarctica]SDF04078.1 Sugar or nucleoside kinase, ribokinase family [Pricia antarctica]